MMKNLVLINDVWNRKLNQLKEIIDYYNEYINLDSIGFPSNWYDILKK